MAKSTNPKLIKLTAYYGLLQTLHLITLTYAGIQLLLGNTSPFPILPPPDGWNPQTMPFMFGLASTDIIGIILGIVFAYLMVFKGKYKRTLGLITLTIFITGAIVFGIGTIPSGSWLAHPFAYWTMVVLFMPTVLLFIQIIKTLHM